MNLAARFLATLREDPARGFLEGDGGDCTRGELAARALRVAYRLVNAGVRPGDRVALSLPKDPWLPACHVGVLAAGAAAVPINPAYPDDAIASLLESAGVALAIGDAALALRATRFAPGLPWWCPIGTPPNGAHALEDAGPQAAEAVARDDGDVALLAFTSGTTGMPKGVPLSHGNLESNLAALEGVWEWDTSDRLLHVLPVFHLHGLGVALYGSLRIGNAVIFHEGFDASRVLHEVPSFRATLLMAVPTMLLRLLEAAHPDSGNPLAGLRCVISGSAPLAPALHRRFRDRFGKAPVERYGMTETMMNASNPLRAPTPASVGRPLPGVELRLSDPTTGSDAGRGPGEVWVRGPNVFGGYWRDPEATRAAFRDGWFRTGDLGRFDETGALYLVGRTKEIIVTGGYNVSPVAVEQALASEEESAVAELAVGGVGDPDLGERVVAFVVLAAGGAADWEAVQASLRARADTRLPRYARPREYRRVSELPRNALGKVERARLGGAQAAT